MKAEEKQRQIAAIEKLLELCNVKNPSASKVFNKLCKIERQAHKSAEDFCNGTNGMDSLSMWEDTCHAYEQDVQALFNHQLKGFFVNGDARGDSLKIKTEVMNTEYKDTGLHKDWGGFGILAP